MKYINYESLLEQHKKQIKGKATGIDGVDKEEYEKELKENIEEIIKEMKAFQYKPKPAKRVYIPKPGSDKLRPLGIPAYRDKIVQGVFAEILNAIYENIFLDCSYGFRPGRSCHDAIKVLNRIIQNKRVNYILDADIKGFFDNVDHKWMIKFLEHTIQDKHFIRYIGRFLNSGIMEQGKKIKVDQGTPQGGLISPILANVYLHYVLDLWVEKDIKKRYKGQVYLIRYADDFVVCFEYEKEAYKFYEELKERLKKFNLSLAEEKTKIIKMGKSNNGSKDSFDFLGFTHHNGKTRKGFYKVVHKTSKKKLKAKKQNAKQWIKDNIQLKPIELIKRLNIKLLGHYRYYGITDNYNKLIEFKNYIIRTLYKELWRRGQKKRLSWKKYANILKHNPIIEPRIYVKLYWGERLLQRAVCLNRARTVLWGAEVENKEEKICDTFVEGQEPKTLIL